MLSLLVYLGGLLVMLLFVNVLLVRMTRAERRRQEHERRARADRRVQ